MSLTMQICPCQVHPWVIKETPLTYGKCCQPYHNDMMYSDGKQAEDAARLMRTRYSAFVFVKPDYIVQTTLPAQQNLLDHQAIESWAKQTDWAGLELITHTPMLGKRHAQVEFKAYFNVSDNKHDDLQAHHELSAFVQVTDKINNEARWYFLDPTVAMSITQKQLCICGSGEKFKRCCGSDI